MSENEENNNDNEENENEEVEPPEGEQTEYVPPSKEDWEKTQAALKRANREATAQRQAATKATQANESAADKAKREAKEAADKVTRYKTFAVSNAARASLSQAGFKGEMKRYLKLIDMDSVDVDDDGEVSGLEDQIDSLKEDYPELFGKKVPKVDAAGKPVVVKPKSASEIAAAQLLGK